MKKSVWISMIVAVGLLLAGIACMVVGLALGGHHDLLEEKTPLTATHFTPEGDFDSVVVDTITADVTFAYAEDGVCRVETRDRESIIYTAEILDGTLLIRAADNRAWYQHLFVGVSANRSVQIYLPAKSLKSLTVDVTAGDVSVPRDFTFSGNVELSSHSGDLTLLAAVEGDTSLETTTGDVTVEGKHKTVSASATTGDVTLRHVDAKELTVSVTTGSIHVQKAVAVAVTAAAGTGDVILEDVITDDAIRVTTTTGDQQLLRVLCGSMTLRAGSGCVTLTESVALGHAAVKTTTGDVTFVRSDAVTLSVDVTTGDVTGSLLTSKIFSVASTSGSVNVPQFSVGGLCEIKTTSGSVRITIEE